MRSLSGRREIIETTLVLRKKSAPGHMGTKGCFLEQIEDFRSSKALFSCICSQLSAFSIADPFAY